MGICNHYGTLVNIGNYEFYHESILSMCDQGIVYEGRPIKDKIFQVGIIELNLKKFLFGDVVNQELFKIMSKLSKLNHRGIAKYLDYVHYSEKIYLIVDYCPHGNLQEIIDNHSTLDPEQAQSYCKQLVEGLAYIHGQGIIHGNLRPNTIFLEYDTVKLSFFGIYEIIKFLSRETRDTNVYVAPENITKAETCNCAADVWALGIVIHQILYKQIPAVNDYGEYKLTNLKTGTFPKFDVVIKRCLESNPNKRIQANELLMLI